MIYTALTLFSSLILINLINQIKADCLPTIPLILDDIHDGDQKVIKSIEWDTFKINPYPNVTDWEVQGKFDINCVSMVDFNVPGKEDYPPVPLKMAMWIMQDIAVPGFVKLGFEFTDPSETLGARTHPLNFWSSSALSDTGPSNFKNVQFPKRKQHPDLKSDTCLYTPHGKPVVYNDMKYSDMKNVTVEGDSLSIEPYSANENWAIESTFEEGCVTMVNFNVPGYPNPSKTPELLSIWEMAAIYGATKDAMVYTEPNTLAGSPLNVWVTENEERND